MVEKVPPWPSVPRLSLPTPPALITCAQAPFVTSVTVIDPAGVETTVWNDTDTTPCGGALVVSLAGDRLVKQVRVHTQATSWAVSYTHLTLPTKA